MDNIIQKFYSNGKDSAQNYHHLGAFSSSMITNRNPISSLTHKTISDIKPIINILNSAAHSINSFNAINPSAQQVNYKTLTPQRPNKMNQEKFLQPRQLVFNSSSDMLYHNPFNYNPRGELNLLKENVSYQNKKNATKMQMIEEKMKNLELKNQRLEVINDFFFDMFENNLVKDELHRQREQKAGEEESKYEPTESTISDSDYRPNRKKHKKFHKSKSEINLNRYDNNNNNFDALTFQKKTTQNARKILDNIKKNIGNYLVEEELKKNEQFQSINEGINELKSDLNYKLERIQKNQKQQMKKIAYCLLYSGDDKIEGMAMRLFNDDFPNINNIENVYNNENDLYKFQNEEYNDNYSMKSKENSNKNGFGNNFRTSALSKRNSLKKNQSQFELTRKPIVKFREDY